MGGIVFFWWVRCNLLQFKPSCLDSLGLFEPQLAQTNSKSISNSLSIWMPILVFHDVSSKQASNSLSIWSSKYTHPLNWSRQCPCLDNVKALFKLSRSHDLFLSLVTADLSWSLYIDVLMQNWMCIWGNLFRPLSIWIYRHLNIHMLLEMLLERKITWSSSLV